MAVRTHELTPLGVSEPRENRGEGMDVRGPRPGLALPHGHPLHMLLVGNVLCH